jgi:molybdopterin biosynthesis enzyme
MQDGPGVYDMVGTVTAGNIPSFTLERGKVAKITTGSPVPDGADAIVMVVNFKENNLLIIGIG